MKKIWFITGITLAVILTVMGCSNPTIGSGSSGGNLGTRPTFKGSIYDEDSPSSSDSGTPAYQYSYKKVAKSGKLNASTGGSATITNGDFTITLEEPILTTLLAKEAFPRLSNWNNVQIDANKPVYYAMLILNVTSGAGDDIGIGILRRSKKEVFQKITNPDTNPVDTSETTTIQTVVYCYVSRDVTISGEENITNSLIGGQIIYKDFRLRLRTGWNAVCQREVLLTENRMTHKTNTVTLSVSNPGYWVFP
ncbi:MAG: hypothetical protein LBH35_01675 [Treponema sp.]|jgi:hypothetical protein|nr:hypothetical protein [Treponema sp.]